jgi:O-antigen ligase
MGVAVYALFQFITGSNKVWTFVSPYKHRGTGTFISPNNLAGFLEMILPISLAWLLVSRAKAVTKIFVAYAAVMIIGGIAVSLSRGGWVAVGVSLVALFGVLLFHRSYRLPAALLLLLMIGAGAYFLPQAHFLKARVHETTANDRLNDSARFDLWEPAARLWQENIWWGIGPNHYDCRFRAYRPQSEQQQPDRVHNDYLNTLTDWGIVGVVLVASSFVLLYVGVARTWRYVRGSSSDLGGGNSNKFALVLGCSLAILAILVHSVVDFNMHIPSNAILAVTLMAMLSSALRFSTEKYWLNIRWPLKIALSIFILAGVCSLGWQEMRAAREYSWLSKANQEAPGSNERIAALEKAFAVEPMNFETAYALGEDFRLQSWEGTDDYEQQAKDAMQWLERSIRLNPYNGYSYLRYGMCLDWIKKTDEGATYFDKALKLDPNGYFTVAWLGWHYFQTGDYAAARTCFERSKRLQWNENVIADSYLPIVTQKLLDEASGKSADDLLSPKRTVK